MEEKNVYKYAFYTIDEKDFYQYLPTSNLSDVIYVKGMKSVKEKSFIKDGNYYIEIDNEDNEIGIGEPVLTRDIIRRYFELDPILQHYDKSTIESYIKDHDAEWTLYGNGELESGWYNSYTNVNNGEIPMVEEPQNIIKGETHWYLELHHDNGSITYEKTIFDDREYRGQDCNFYTLVRVLEYKLNGNYKRIIIERDSNQYPHQIIHQTALDDITDKAKGLISHQISYDDFKGVSPLYSFNTEDSACVFYDNQDKIKDSIVTTVIGSGDPILDLFLYGAKKVIAFDTNIMTIFYGELKFIAAKYLPFDDFDTLFTNFDEKIYKQLSLYLSNSTHKVWNKLYLYSKLVNKPIKNQKGSGLFYTSLFENNSTLYNEKGYYTPENYLKLQQILRNKSLDDIIFINCDLFELPNKVDLSDSSYAYLSNIMDFYIGNKKDNIDRLKLFKDFILNKLLPSLKENANIELSYLKRVYHQKIEKNYSDIYPINEGFEFYLLSNKRDSVLSFRNNLLLENNIKPKSF